MDKVKKVDKVKQLEKALKKLVKYCKNEELILISRHNNIHLNFNYSQDRFYRFKEIFRLVDLEGELIALYIIGIAKLEFDIDIHNVDSMLDIILSDFDLVAKINSDDYLGLDILNPGILIDIE